LPPGRGGEGVQRLIDEGIVPARLHAPHAAADGGGRKPVRLRDTAQGLAILRVGEILRRLDRHPAGNETVARTTRFCGVISMTLSPSCSMDNKGRILSD
jgi:hypothetical protein